MHVRALGCARESPFAEREGRAFVCVGGGMRGTDGDSLAERARQLVQHFLSRGLKPAGWTVPGADFYDLPTDPAA